MDKKIELKDEERQECEVVSRVMGYFRPVSFWNIGKKQEWADRVHFKEEKFKKDSIPSNKLHP